MATIRQLGPPDNDQLQAWLSRRRASSMFLASNSRQAPLGSSEGPFAGVYFGAFDEAGLVGVAAHYARGSVVVCAPEHAGELAAAAARSSARPIVGVNGPEADVDAATVALFPAGVDYVMDQREALFELEFDALQLPPPLVASEVSGRPLARTDRERFVAWRLAYDKEAIGLAITDTRRRAKLDEFEREVDTGGTWVLEHQGEAVALTSFNARLDDTVQVGGVWTPPQLRGRGYARAVVADHLRAWRARGIFRAVLFTGDDNIPAQRAYRAIGFVVTGRYRLCMLRSPVAVGPNS